MAWRRWSVIVVLLLANYLVFSIMATWLFPVPSVMPPTHVPKPTFTPGGKEWKQVDPLTYEFLTPSPTVTLTRRPGATGTPATPTSATVVATATLTATLAVSDTATFTPTATVTATLGALTITPTITATSTITR